MTFGKILSIVSSKSTPKVACSYWVLAFFLACSVIATTTHANNVSVTDLLSTQHSSSDSSKKEGPSEEDPKEQEENKLDLGISELIDTNKLGDYWAESILNPLEKYNFSESLMGKILVTAILIFPFMLFFYFSKKFILKAIHKIQALEKVGYIPYNRISFYLKYINFMLKLLFICVYLMAVSGIWYEKFDDSFYYSPAKSSFQFIATFSFLFILGAFVFEAVSSLMERFFARWGDPESARVRTLLPIVRNTVNMVLFVILGITLISELGINIMPLIAGAGIVGIAVGFGAQTFFKDLITGFVIILEDLMQIGDVVTLGDKTGVIEMITTRKIQLRALDGTVYTIPFSEISIIENKTKDFSYYVFDIGVAYKESPDHVIEILEALGAEIQNDDNFKSLILEPLEILGVDAFLESAIIIKARIKTRPGQQWKVGRELNRRIKYRFDETGIEIPFPHRTLYFGKPNESTAEEKLVQRASRDLHLTKTQTDDVDGS
jgi:moderate conductance mechanosensitive channel